VLLVEDDRRIGSLVLAALREAAYDVVWSLTGGEAIAMARTLVPDLVVLDLGLPDLDGLEVCRMLRSAHAGAVIVMLTARGEDMDVIAGLESGADDYVTKPFGMTVLLARIQAHLRRYPPREDAEAIVDGDLLIDPAGRRCLIDQLEIPLRAKQFDLLERLARDLGRAIPRATLMADVWDEDIQGENWSGSTKTLDVHVASLRERLTRGARQAATASGREVRMPRIATVRSIGYRLDSHHVPGQAGGGPGG
jgi:DNA-binding response OmpR family regulator